MTEMHFAWALPEGWTCKRRLTRYQTSTRPRAFAVATAAGCSAERVPLIRHRTAGNKPLQLVCPSLAAANSRLQALHRADRDTHSSRTQSVQPSGPERTSSTTAAAAAATAARDGAGQAAAHAASSCSDVVSHTDHVMHGPVGLNAAKLPLRLQHNHQHLSGHAVGLAADRQLGAHLHPDHTLAVTPEQQVQVHQGFEQSDSRLLLLKITHASDAAELHAVLQPSWQQLGPAHTAAALQQLVKLHQEQQHLPRRQGRHQQTPKAKRQRQQLKQQQQQQPAATTVGPAKQPGLVQLGRQLLAHATQLAAAASSAGSPAAAAAAATAASARSFTAADAADVLHAAADLQLVPPAPEHLLHQLLCQAMPSVGALTAARLTQLLQAAAWMLEQTQQQQQQQPVLQALSAEPHQAVQPECSQQQQQAAAPDASPKLLQQQQRNSGLHQLARPGRALSPEQQHTLLEAKRQQLLQPRAPQQQQSPIAPSSGAVVRALQDLLQRWCQAAWQQQQQQLEGVGVCLSPQLLAELLAVFLQVKLLPTATCLQQLLSLSGLPSKQNKDHGVQQTQHRQVALQQEQQQHGQDWSAAAASEVLVGLEGLLQLECNERSSSSSSRVGGGLLLPVLQQHADQLLLLTAQTAADWQECTAQQQGVEGAAGVGGQDQQQTWPVVVALSAVARLLVLTGTGGRPSSSTISSGSGHSSAAAATLASGQQQQQVLLVSSSCLRVLMDVLLAAVTPYSRQQDRQALRYQQQQPLAEAVLSCADVVLAVETTCRLYKLQQQWHHHHHQQQQQQAPSGASVSATLESSSSSSSMMQGDNRVVRPLRFQLWLQAFVPCALHPFGRMKRASAAELTAVFALLSAHRAHLPPWWLDEAQVKVLHTVEQLCASSTAGLPAAAAVGADSSAEAAATAEARPGALAWSSPAPPDAASAAQLLHSWVQLLQVQPKRKAPSTAEAGTEAAAASAAASAGGGVAGPPHFRRSSRFMQRLCAALAPVLQDMDISILGLTAASVALLGLTQEQQQQQHWTQAILQAMAASAARAAGILSQPGTPPPAAAASAAGVVVLPAAAAAAAVQEGCRLPGAALVSLLQALVVLRVRPPQPLLHQLLVLLRRDMVLENGPVLVQLLVVLGQLQYRPGPEWLRAVMLRLQGRLRLLSFDQLTQLCWCLVQLGVQPPQCWLDDFMDAAAAHILTERKQQQRWEGWHKQQQQQQQGQQGPVQQQQGPVQQAPPPARGHTQVHPWQLQVMHWAVLRCWHYRSNLLHGKLQWRAVRELNSAAWRAPQARQLQRLQEQLRQVEQQFARSSRTGASGGGAVRRKVVRLERRLAARKARGQSIQTQHGEQRRRQQLHGLPVSSSSSSSSNGFSSSKLYKPRGELRSRACWVDGALWPKQWQAVTLPALP